VDLEDKVVGECFPIPMHSEFECKDDKDLDRTMDISKVHMTSFFWCNSTVW